MSQPLKVFVDHACIATEVGEENEVWTQREEQME